MDVFAIVIELKSLGENLSDAEAAAELLRSAVENLTQSPPL